MSPSEPDLDVSDAAFYDRETGKLETVAEIQAAAETPTLTTDQRIDAVMQAVLHLHAKVDNLTNGVVATHQGVTGIGNMLQAVQQVASMMPGMGGKFAKMIGQNGNGNG